uniref:DNA replication protein n=2 Tax=Bovine herpesvirus 4 TaxID=10385 RepID=A0A0F6N5B4_BHV4|nr:DNA replication protein [Bovine gammaherpesvirus 4]QJC19157.1 DNA replication protein [Bovine gammaherpesvirus 4]
MNNRATVTKTKSYPRCTTPKYKVLFATDGDCAEAIADVLCKSDSSTYFYPVIHNCFNTPSTAQVILSMCLPNKRPGGARKCSEIFQLKLDTSAALSFLLAVKPIPSSTLQTWVDFSVARKCFDPLLEIIMLDGKQCQEPMSTFSTKICWFRAKFVTALRKLYKMTPSPYWMVTTFGCYEIQFILVSVLYFFEKHCLTVETISHLARLFEPRRGQFLAAVNTYLELATIFSTSCYLTKVPAFVEYIKLKLARDDMEAEAIDKNINEFRSELILSNQDLVQYVYLSFFQCLNKQNFLQYSKKTLPENIHILDKDPILTKFIDQEFKDKMATYYNKSMYLNTCISIHQAKVPNVSGYLLQSSPTNQPQYWCGQAKDVQVLLGEINKHYPHLLLPEEFQGLLDLAALDGDSGPKGGIFMTPGKNPVYRCEFLNKYYFVMVSTDYLETHWKKNILLPVVDCWWAQSDEFITENITYVETFYSMHSIKDQLCLSRHEYFNPRLPVFNLVMDFDLKVITHTRPLLDIYRLCLRLRDSVLDVLHILGPVEKDHPVYFFKSACPVLVEDTVNNRFCNCNSKIGLRIITRFPNNVVLVGSDPLISLVTILNRIVKLDKELVKMYPEIMRDNGPFDVGIYHRGRSVRLPHTYKVGDNGALTHLLKIIVCHPYSADKRGYVIGAYELKNLLHHAGHSQKDMFSTVYAIEDINENFLSSKTQESLQRSSSLMSTKLDALFSMDITDWILNTVWPRIFDNINLYFPDDKVHQFAYVKFLPTQGNIVQVKPLKGSNFRCLTFNHRGKVPTVRIFLVFHIIKEHEVIITFMSQCFANKCNSNKSIAHFSVIMAIPLQSQ